MILRDGRRMVGSEREAARALGTVRGNVVAALNGFQRTCKGHVLKRYEGE